jgi:hypothetical protein
MKDSIGVAASDAWKASSNGAIEQRQMRRWIKLQVERTGNDLLEEGPDGGHRQADALADIFGSLGLVHEGLEIVRDELKHQVQAAGLGLDDVQELDLLGSKQTHNICMRIGCGRAIANTSSCITDEQKVTHYVGMVELPEQRDLPNDVARDAALRGGVGERDALNGHRLTRVVLGSAVHDPVRPLSDDFRSNGCCRVFGCARE